MKKLHFQSIRNSILFLAISALGIFLPKTASADALDALPVVFGTLAFLIILQICGVVFAFLYFKNNKKWTFKSALVIGIIGLLVNFFVKEVDAYLEYFNYAFFYPSLLMFALLSIPNSKIAFHQQHYKQQLVLLISTIVFGGILISFTRIWTLHYLLNGAAVFAICYKHAEALFQQQNFNENQVYFQIVRLTALAALITFTINILSFSNLIDLPMNLIANLLNLLQQIFIFIAVGAFAAFIAKNKLKTKNQSTP